MGIFLVPVPSRKRQPRLSVEDRLWMLRQDDRPLEQYVEEFAELSSQVSWPDAILNSCFLRGLDEDTIRFCEPECLYSLVESINLVLSLNGSEFEIEEVHSGCAPGLQPETTPKPSKRRATKRSRRSKRPVFAEAAPVFVEPASACQEPPSEEKWLIDFWTEPAPPAFPEPRSSLPRAPLQPSPSPAPAAHEPAPAAPPWPAKAPDPPWPPTAHWSHHGMTVRGWSLHWTTVRGR
ncbi:hypothetical protein DPX16_13971 [Anabarilius grahami]|uniref:Retrotransposon gag domain-containing protein n=1 Tax=Anabarilius grahami TaxID=495550 RepID=A0A3N0Y8U6_ANAGA|nr:hypothetical protein DPX16_13971 [Anabarilius grahami]